MPGVRLTERFSVVAAGQGSGAMDSLVQAPKIDPGFDAFVAERLLLRPHQRSYAALQTALRCIASPSGLYTAPHLGASLAVFLCSGGHDVGT